MDKSDCVEETFKQYEDELLLLFKNCDHRKTGHLTTSEFNELLNVLQLDNSYKDQLLTILSSNSTVTFDLFKESLLNIIYTSSNEVKREISPEREVSPKLVVGAKKYGRRSKPENNEKELEESSTQAVDNEEHMDNEENVGAVTHSEDEFSHLNELHCAQNSLDELFPQMSNKRGSDVILSASLEVDNNIKAGYIHYDTLQELWESQGIVNTTGLLQLLGIEPGTEISIDQLSQLLEELRQSDSTNTQVLIGSLCLAQVQNKLIKSHLEQLMFERDKLRTDVLHANKRASLIAAEIDDNYSKIESSVQKQLRQVEDKHGEVVKNLHESLSQEREQLNNLREKYERDVARYQENINLLTSEISEKQKQHEKLSHDFKALLEEHATLERNSHVHREQASEILLLKRKLQYLESSNQSLSEFESAVIELRAENTMLRDRNDEMGVKLENALRKYKQHCESPAACKRRTEDSENLLSSSGGKLRKFNTRQDVSMSVINGLCPSPLSTPSASPHSSKNLSAFYEETRALQLEFPPCEYPSDDIHLALDSSDTHHLVLDPLLEAVDIEEDEEERNFTTFIKRRSPLNSDSIESQFNTFQSEIQKLLSEKRLCDEENQKLKQEVVALKTELTRLDSLEQDSLNQSQDELTKVKVTDSPGGGLNLKSFAFDISFDSLTTSPNKKSENKNMKKKNKKKNMETSCNNNNNDVVEDSDNDNQFRTMTLHREIDDRPADMESISLEQSTDDLRNENKEETYYVNKNDLANESCKLDRSNVLDEEMCVSNKVEPVCSVQIQDTMSNTKSSDSKDQTPMENADGIITVIKKVESNDEKSDIKQWLNGVKSNSTKWTRETLEECLKQPHPLWKLATLEAFLNEREELLNKCFYLETYIDKYDTIKTEKQELEEKCQDLTNCLEQMKVEFERLEDYWTAKMDDERKLFEQEQAVSSEKYIELELKINEYAELFSKADEDEEMIETELSCTGMRYSGSKLPTIDETEMYERQVMDLEEEIQGVRDEMRQKDQMIVELRLALNERESANAVHTSSLIHPVPAISIEQVDATPPHSSLEVNTPSTSSDNLEHLQQSVNPNASFDIVAISPSQSSFVPLPDSIITSPTSQKVPDSPNTPQVEASPSSQNSSQLDLFNSNQNDWSSSSIAPSINLTSPSTNPLAPSINSSVPSINSAEQYLNGPSPVVTSATSPPLQNANTNTSYSITKEYKDSSAQTSGRSIDSAAVQTDMFLDEMDSLSFKLDPERISHYERVLNNQVSSPNNSSIETPKLHKKMRRHKKNHQRATNQVSESRTPDLISVVDSNDNDTLSQLHKQNMNRLASSDLLVKDLYVKDCVNMAKIHNLERELLLERNKNHTRQLSC